MARVHDPEGRIRAREEVEAAIEAILEEAELTREEYFTPGSVLDMRVDHEGRIFILEINPNCGVYYPPTDPGGADLCLLHDPAGHEGFTKHLIEAAMARQSFPVAMATGSIPFIIPLLWVVARYGSASAKAQASKIP